MAWLLRSDAALQRMSGGTTVPMPMINMAASFLDQMNIE
jgi:hypothetical protein